MEGEEEEEGESKVFEGEEGGLRLERGLGATRADRGTIPVPWRWMAGRGSPDAVGGVRLSMDPWRTGAGGRARFGGAPVEEDKEEEEEDEEREGEAATAGMGIPRAVKRVVLKGSEGILTRGFSPFFAGSEAAAEAAFEAAEKDAT